MFSTIRLNSMGGRDQMELHHHNHRALAGISPSSSSAGSSAAAVTNGNNSGQPPPPSDPMHSWWESISKARSRIETLASLLPPSLSPTLSALADSDRPALSLLSSSAAYSAVSSSLSGSSSDPLCHWLYDTYLSSDPHLRLLVSSFLPLVSSLYLSLLHSPESAAAHSLAGFEAVLLAVYSAECKSRAGKPILVHVPDLSYPSLYHNPRSSPAGVSAGAVVGTGVLSPPLEPQTAVKSTKRACIVGVALDYYYKHIAQMPPWSKTELCRAVSSWAGGGDCPCAGDLDQNDDEEDEDEISDGIAELRIENGGSVRGSRVPLPWELLQPTLRILGHCLLAPLSPPEVKDEAAAAVRRLYARASHDLAPQAILATRSLIQLDNRTRADERNVASTAMTGNSSSNVNTPSKAKKPEILLVSK